MPVSDCAGPVLCRCPRRRKVPRLVSGASVKWVGEGSPASLEMWLIHIACTRRPKDMILSMQLTDCRGPRQCRRCRGKAPVPMSRQHPNACEPIAFLNTCEETSPEQYIHVAYRRCPRVRFALPNVDPRIVPRQRCGRIVKGRKVNTAIKSSCR